MPGSLTGTIGLTLSSCAPPGSNDIFELGPDEMEVGLGGYFISAISGVARILVWGGGGNVSTALYDLVI